MILFTILGWVLVNFATWLYFDYLGELAQSLPEGPEKEETRDKWATDGASLTRCSLWRMDTRPLLLSFLANRWLDCKEAKILEGSE